MLYAYLSRATVVFATHLEVALGGESVATSSYFAHKSWVSCGLLHKNDDLLWVCSIWLLLSLDHLRLLGRNDVRLLTSEPLEISHFLQYIRVQLLRKIRLAIWCCVGLCR